jgi:Uncharacterized protein conserved in bacteria (DUF2171)
MGSGEAISWLMIEPGWHVLSSEGDEVGRVDEVTGDSNTDIFDGLVVSLRMFGKLRYVAAEQVAEITDGHVRLTLDRVAAENLPEYQEPGEAVELSSEKASFVQRVESDVVPAPRTEHISFVRRILLWFGLAGRR